MLTEGASALSRLAAELRPVQLQGLTEHLVGQMKDWVLRGLVRPGERLPPERELAAMLKVSRSSLRQALKVLQTMGVLEARQGSGTYLSQAAETILRQPTDLLMPLRGLSFAEVFEARRAIEAEACASAAMNASESDLWKLRRELESMGAYRHDPAVYFRHDVAFHRRIAMASGNNVFVWFHELASKVLADAWLARAKEGNTERTFCEHQAILEAIEAREPEAARQALLRHLSLTKFYSTEQMLVELRVVSTEAVNRK
jgi:GntR family transcriptional repressor for pyruvate dehydrogenase complex